jgi:hypothetical protein
MPRTEEDLSVNDTSLEEESNDNSTPEEPAMLLDTNQSIPLVTHWLQNVILDDMSVNRSTTRNANREGLFKMNSPTEFSG